jgi:hypothetical protein
MCVFRFVLRHSRPSLDNNLCRLSRTRSPRVGACIVRVHCTSVPFEIWVLLVGAVDRHSHLAARLGLVCRAQRSVVVAPKEYSRPPPSCKDMRFLVGVFGQTRIYRGKEVRDYGPPFSRLQFFGAGLPHLCIETSLADRGRFVSNKTNGTSLPFPSRCMVLGWHPSWRVLRPKCPHGARMSILVLLPK